MIRMRQEELYMNMATPAKDHSNDVKRIANRKKRCTYCNPSMSVGKLSCMMNKNSKKPINVPNKIMTR